MDKSIKLPELFEDLASICNFELDQFEEEIMVYARQKLGIEIEDESEFWDIFSEWIHSNIHRFHLSAAINE
ncbi:MAG: hypothetical protein A2161_20835 [Candidatus Schekmanbacteria bacterium RBG_13_48_7]|uniref:Uncharacterized protein n=1 Tax=Candidatus Schekmanbacteria bacterium RBG_13_48_7 TaxID=1817878 RepID=A0A1F7RTJ2_9BACT|nr:MAG: hypothetical protein A2161_20835 [Candidatus Schekmanbacteria bacterium RBG_13_48_7]